MLATRSPRSRTASGSSSPTAACRRPGRSGPAPLWHDGTPVTSDDMAFTAQVGADKDLPAFGNAAYASIEGVETPDPDDGRRAVVASLHPGGHDVHRTRSRCRCPNTCSSAPTPKTRRTSPASPYWTNDFVGTGPFKLRDWAQGQPHDPRGEPGLRPGPCRSSTRSKSDSSPTRMRSSRTCSPARSSSPWAAAFRWSRGSRCATSGRTASWRLP